MASHHPNVQNWQLHKRRLAAAPRPYILQPFVSPEPSYVQPVKSQAAHTLKSVSPKYNNTLPKYDNQGHKIEHVPARRVAGLRGLDLQLIGLPDPITRAVPVRRPALGGSPRGDRPTGYGSPQRGLPREYELADEDHGIFETDSEWVDKCAHFEKPDGRRYKVHERRLNPAPKPVKAPSLYMDDSLPKGKPSKQKHDYVTFLTKGELAPGPTLRDVADKAVDLQDRLDSINDRNQAVEASVETLWRLQQSWGMQRPEVLQWGTGLERPAVLANAPSRQFRTNISLKDLTYRVVQEGKNQVGYELTNGTLMRKGKHQVKVAGQWSMFKGEPQQLAPAAPVNFSSKKQVQRELRRQRVNGTAGPVKSSKGKADGASRGMPDAELKGIMSQVRDSVADMSRDMKAMKSEITSLDPDKYNEDEDEPEVQPQQGLLEDLSQIKGQLDENKVFSQSHAKGHIYIGDGQSQELVAIGGMDAGDDDDLEDRIRKPKHQSITERVIGSRDCFTMAKAKKERREAQLRGLPMT